MLICCVICTVHDDYMECTAPPPCSADPFVNVRVPSSPAPPAPGRKGSGEETD
eukprot:m.39576 g.39576  ORF g.39576 m.39576 type:complete len:53 (-) comp9569_c0_seq1:1943-2101(-)